MSEKMYEVPTGLHVALQSERPQLLTAWLESAKAEGANEMLLAAIELLALRDFNNKKKLRALTLTLELVEDTLKGVNTTSAVAMEIINSEIPQELYSSDEVYRHFKESLHGGG